MLLDVCRKTPLNPFLLDNIGHLLHMSIYMLHGYPRGMGKWGMCPLSKPIHSILVQILGIWNARWVYALSLARKSIVGWVWHGITSLVWHGMVKV